MSAADGDAAESKSAAPSPGNGSSGDGYLWTQTLKDVTIIAQVPVGTPGKSLHCEFRDDWISLGVKGVDARILEGKLGGSVQADECMWNIDRADGTVTVHLDKKERDNWWNCIVEGETVIDVGKVAPDNSKLSDLDGETRGMVEKMMYDQRQKAAGKPTSDEQRQHDMLRKFKEQHPEMDFSGVKMG